MRISVLPAAQGDLFQQADYYDEHGGEGLGDRFIASCEAGFARLSSYPQSGSPVSFKNDRLKGCRFIIAPGFDKTMIFYRLLEDKVQIIRILHGSRDIEKILSEETLWQEKS